MRILIFVLFFFMCSCSGETWDISFKDQKGLISAGKLRNELVVENQSIISNMRLQTDTSADKFSFVLWKASPNEEPQGIEHMETSVEQSASIKNQTDALDITFSAKNTFQSIRWIDSTMICSASGLRFKSHEVENAKRLKLLFEVADVQWEGINVEVIYEIYEGYPVIRKWINLTNSGKNWVKISDFSLTDLNLSASYNKVTHLTPRARDIDPSIIAFGNEDASRGVILASEVPSKLRVLTDHGVAAYHPGYFEWVIGPEESFDSESGFIYAFDGSNSIMDRCVETDFRDFLKEHILLPVDSEKMVAPLYCTWTNYAAGINDANMRQAADIASTIGFKCFQLDAGWSKTSFPNKWGVSTINPDLDKFPDLKGLNDCIRSKNMKAGLWYSVFMDEALVQSSDVPPLFSLPLIKRAGGLGISFTYDKSINKYADDIIYLSKTYGATYFKQDLSNICYGDIAKGHGSRTLKESYLRGLRGLFASQDRIHAAVPDAFLQLSHEIYWETPGPTGDIAVLKHVDLYHSAPNEYWGAGKRGQLVSDSWNMNKDSLSQKLIQGCFRARKLWYDHRGLPLERIEVFGAAITNYKGSLTPEIQDRQICSWLMGAPLSFSGDLTALTQENIERYRNRFAILEELQQKYNIYFNFQYSGVPGPTDEDWHWWGKLNNEGCGAVVVLRGSEGNDSRKINIPWVKAENKYSVKALFADRDLGVFTGKQLQSGALELSLECFGQEILEVKK